MRLIGRFIRQSRAEKQLDAELRFHLEQRVEAFVRGGMPEDEARRRARLEFGGLQQIKEDVREATVLATLDNLAADVRYALRALKRSPGFAAAAMVALALGSGGTTALATILNDLVRRPPRMFRDAHQLVVASETSPRDPSSLGIVAAA